MAEDQWLPIETAPKTRQPWTMFVVIAFNIKPQHCSSLYTTDPYCVWREDDGSFARWPHSFEPTHWCSLPDHNPKSQPQISTMNATSTSLSPAAQATLDAYHEEAINYTEEWGSFRHKRGLALALRAAVYQKLPQTNEPNRSINTESEHDVVFIGAWHIWNTENRIRREILSIAAELEVNA